MKTLNVKSDYSVLSRVYGCDRGTVRDIIIVIVNKI